LALIDLGRSSEEAISSSIAKNKETDGVGEPEGFDMIPPKGGNEGPHGGDNSQRDADARKSGGGAKC